METICLAGRHVRPYMENAKRHGHQVAALDGFNDWDAGRFGTLIRRGTSFGGSPEDFFSAVASLPDGPLILCAPIESCPRVMEKISRSRRVLNASPTAVAACRDIGFLRLAADGAIALPEISFRPGKGEPGWIVKNPRSAGGAGIRADDGTLLPGEYRQKAVEGDAVGAVFFSCGADTRLCGAARQINEGFLFAGGIYPADVEDGTRADMERFGQTLAGATGLRGWWGADFIVGRERTFLLEVNPRFTASLELLATAHGLDIVGTQAGAMGDLCHIELKKNEGYSGRRVCYAERDCVFNDADKWFAKGARDIPHPGSRVAQGAPILSLYAHGQTAESCRHKLDADAASLHRELYGL